LDTSLYKTPEMSATVCIDYWLLRDAKICRMSAVLADSMSMVDRGPYFEQPAEFSAFERWNKGDFLGVERLFAKRWGPWLSVLDFSVAYPIEA
jgi:hypothetical protein